MSSSRVVVTGLGLVSPIGIGIPKAWDNLLQGKTGVTSLKSEHQVPGLESTIAAYVPDDDLEHELNFTRNRDIKRQMKHLSRSTIFSLIASHEALRDANLLTDDGDPIGTHQWNNTCGVAIGTGMVDLMDIHTNSTLLETKGYKRLSPHFITRMLLNMGAGNVSIRHNITGPNHCASTACTTGAHSIGDAFNFIQLGYAPMMLCGSTEAPINTIAMAGFGRIRALACHFNDVPSKASRPFDLDRCGFVMGEGSGILVLENFDHAMKRKAKIYAEILGYGLSADAHNLTAPSPHGDGAYNSMKSAVTRSKIDRSSINHVNAHATSTPLGDEIEVDAISRLLDAHKQKIHVTSCKGSIGHLLGAAGSVETVFSVLSCYHSMIPPSLNIVKPIETSLEICRTPTEWLDSRRILIKNSFGFGGTNASLVISNFNL